MTSIFEFQNSLTFPWNPWPFQKISLTKRQIICREIVFRDIYFSSKCISRQIICRISRQIICRELILRNKFPWLFPDFNQNLKIPWLFPDLGHWSPCSIHRDFTPSNLETRDRQPSLDRFVRVYPTLHFFRRRRVGNSMSVVFSHFLYIEILHQAI